MQFIMVEVWSRWPRQKPNDMVGRSHVVVGVHVGPDASTVRRLCGTVWLRQRVLKTAICYRLRMELDCRKRWPLYASYAKFRNPDWNRHFDTTNGHRVVMHDSTNIPYPNPSSGDLNRALHNKYYGMCCAKAGIAVQLCCWIHGLPLVTGHSDDDRQIQDTKILPQQKEFSDSDPTSNRPFLNIFDKGYHQRLDAQKYRCVASPTWLMRTLAADLVLSSKWMCCCGTIRQRTRCKRVQDVLVSKERMYRSAVGDGSAV